MVDRYVALCLTPRNISSFRARRRQEYAVLRDNLELILARGSPHCAGSDFADWLFRTGCNGLAGTFVIDYAIPQALVKDEKGWAYEAVRMTPSDQDIFTEWLYAGLVRNAKR